jgi:hypothetical protein
LLGGPLPSTSVNIPNRNFIDKPFSGVTLIKNQLGAVFFVENPAQFNYRPSQADQLHVSIKWGNEWITENVGTFSYNSNLVGADGSNANQHSVVTVNSGNPMRRFSRFLWLPWTPCQRTIKSNQARASHQGYPNFYYERTYSGIASRIFNY